MLMTELSYIIEQIEDKYDTYLSEDEVALIAETLDIINEAKATLLAKAVRGGKKAFNKGVNTVDQLAWKGVKTAGKIAVPFGAGAGVTAYYGGPRVFEGGKLQANFERDLPELRKQYPNMDDMELSLIYGYRNSPWRKK